MRASWWVGLIAWVSLGDSRAPKDTLPKELANTPPYGLPERVPEPADNPFTPERLELGRALFFDPILSLDRTISCATCHHPDHGFAEPAARSTGVGGRSTERNAPTLFNRAFGARHMWDGRFETLEEQVLMPIENELEMALEIKTALERLASEPVWVAKFERAYGAISRDNLARALATFVRRLWFADSPIDRFRRGEVGGLTKEERAGMWIFESNGRCWKCHNGPNFSDEALHNTGVGARDGRAMPGRAAVTGLDEDLGKFKTPTLRALRFTAPYMHDGSLATLAEVVDFYVRGGGANEHLDERVQPLELSESDARALVAFLEALSKP